MASADAHAPRQLRRGQTVLRPQPLHVRPPEKVAMGAPSRPGHRDEPARFRPPDDGILVYSQQGGGLRCKDVPGDEPLHRGPVKVL